MSGQLPRLYTETFTIEFNDKGYRFRAKAKLTIDLNEVRHHLGRKAGRNAGERSRIHATLVELIAKPSSVGPERPELGTVCYE